MLTVGSKPEELITRICNLQWMLKWSICHAFEQSRKPVDSNKINDDGTIRDSEAMDFLFRLGNPHGEELRLRLWGPSNYVHVLIREESGPAFSRETLDWEHRCCHDSCWRDAVNDIIRQFPIERWGIGDPWKLVVLTEDEQNHIRKLRKEKEGR